MAPSEEFRCRRVLAFGLSIRLSPRFSLSAHTEKTVHRLQEVANLRHPNELHSERHGRARGQLTRREHPAIVSVADRRFGIVELPGHVDELSHSLPPSRAAGTAYPSAARSRNHGTPP